MKITEIRVSLVDDPKLKAFATITIDGDFVIQGLKIIEGKSGMFVAMPARKRADGEWQDIAHPINNQARADLENAVLSAYSNELEKGGEEPE
jgi:stage V sporulation protein G